MTERYVELDGKMVRVPSDTNLQRWTADVVCPAPDGCLVEHDGQCRHGQHSWLAILGLV